MLKKFAAGLLATALIAAPAFAQTSNSTVTPGSAAAASAPAKTTTKTTTTAPANTMTAPAATNAKQTANPSKKHVKLHKKTVKHVASRSHVKSGKMHQARHVKPVKSPQVDTSAAAKRS